MTGDENFRVRVAREKRERMHLRLLAATMEAYTAHSGNGPMVIDDVIKTAKVSRGTFYKYFDSVEAALAVVGSNLVEETISGLLGMFEGVDDPLHRTASGIQLMMLHAIMDPLWGRFVVHTPHLASASSIIAAIRNNTQEGLKRGDFHFRSLEAAIDYQIAITFDAIERLLGPLPNRAAYMDDMTRMCLIGLGVEPARAANIIKISKKDIRQRAPQALSWWRSVDLHR